MKKLFPLLALLILGSCQQKSPTEESVPNAGDKVAATREPSRVQFLDNKVPIYNFESFKPLLEQKNDTTYIVNFWATWCEPCVAEMPYFEQLRSQYEQESVKVLLVNLDMKSMWTNRLLPFLEKKQLHSEVVILDDPKQNKWIPQVDENWGGGIPATLIYRGDERAFYEQGFTFEQLEEAFLKIHTSSPIP